MCSARHCPTMNLPWQRKETEPAPPWRFRPDSAKPAANSLGRYWIQTFLDLHIWVCCSNANRSIGFLKGSGSRRLARLRSRHHQEEPARRPARRTGGILMHSAPVSISSLALAAAGGWFVATMLTGPAISKQPRFPQLTMDQLDEKQKP